MRTAAVEGVRKGPRGSDICLVNGLGSKEFIIEGNRGQLRISPCDILPSPDIRTLAIDDPRGPFAITSNYLFQNQNIGGVSICASGTPKFLGAQYSAPE